MTNLLHKPILFAASTSANGSTCSSFPNSVENDISQLSNYKTYGSHHSTGPWSRSTPVVNTIREKVGFEVASLFRCASSFALAVALIVIVLTMFAARTRADQRNVAPPTSFNNEHVWIAHEDDYRIKTQHDYDAKIGVDGRFDVEIESRDVYQRGFVQDSGNEGGP